jgi:hypothetical protein
MDWGALLAGATQSDGSIAPPSKYQSITKNFYASTGYDAIFGVSGGGPGFYYDGVKVNASNVSVPGNFSRILTGYAADKDKPRSVEAHQNHLMYGYLAGTVQQSDSANVLVFDPTLGNRDATEYGFSDRVTGIRSINGDSMAVWTQSTVQMIQGQVDAGNAYASTIAPTSGGIEYSIQPMANFMYADFRGITMIGATQKYGDFEVGHVSSEVSPFLLPRLQLSSLLESGAIGFLNSVLIRSKNMERKFFADGYCMSMTFLVDGENPQFSIQQYLKSDGVTPAPWSVVQAFTESSGRDRIFGAIADGTGFVYELKRGNTFDGLAIPRHQHLRPGAGLCHVPAVAEQQLSGRRASHGRQRHLADVRLRFASTHGEGQAVRLVRHVCPAAGRHGDRPALRRRNERRSIVLGAAVLAHDSSTLVHRQPTEPEGVLIWVSSTSKTA